MGRGPSKRQMGVGFDDNLRAKLEMAATAAGRSIAEEIRTRVEQTFAAPSVDGATQALADAVLGMALEVKTEVGRAWHADPGAYRTLRRAIMMALAKWRPAGVPDSTLEKLELTPF